MISKTCFVCTGEIRGKRTTAGNPSQENSFLLCQILDLPHVLGDEVQKSSEIRYCPGCTNRITSIVNMLDELEKLERNVSDEKYKIELLMKENSTNLNSTIPSEELRTKIVRELKANSIQSMLGKIRSQAKKRVRIMENVSIPALRISTTTTQNTGLNSENPNPTLGTSMSTTQSTDLNAENPNPTLVTSMSTTQNTDLNVGNPNPALVTSMSTTQNTDLNVGNPNPALGTSTSTTQNTDFNIENPNPALVTSMSTTQNTDLNVGNPNPALGTSTSTTQNTDFNAENPNPTLLTSTSTIQNTDLNVENPNPTLVTSTSTTENSNPEENVNCARLQGTSKTAFLQQFQLFPRASGTAVPHQQCFALTSSDVTNHNNVENPLIADTTSASEVQEEGSSMEMNNIKRESVEDLTMGDSLQEPRLDHVPNNSVNASTSQVIVRRHFLRTTVPKQFKGKPLNVKIGPKVKKFTCGICKCDFNNHLQLTAHRRSHVRKRLSMSPSDRIKKIRRTKRYIFSRRISRAKLSRQPKKSVEGGKMHSSHKNRQHRVRNHHDDAKHKCTICDFACRNRDLMRTHMKTDHSDKKSLKCPFCGELFIRKISLGKHVASKHQTLPNNEQTNINLTDEVKDETISKRVRPPAPGATPPSPKSKSNKMLTKPKILIISGKIPRKDRPYRQPKKCDTCGKMLSNQSNLNKHLLTHQREGNHKCTVPICDFECQDQSLLNTHMTTNHSGKSLNSVKCNLCDKSFLSQNSLDRHVAGKHPTRTQTLPEPTSTPLKKKFKVEIVSKKAEPPAPVPVVNKSKARKCEECGKTFSTPGALKIHMKGIHKKQDPFKCTVCDFECHFKAGIDSHMLTHEEERNFQCDFCEKSFKHRGSIYRHVKLKHSESPDFELET